MRFDQSIHPANEVVCNTRRPCHWPLCCVAVLLCALFPVSILADNADDAYQLAAGYYKKERWDLAASGFEKFIKDHPKHPKSPTARFFQGLSLVNAGDYKGAREALRTFVQESPMSRNAAHALYRIAEASYLLDDLPRAEPELTAFLTKHPEDPLVDRAMPYLADVQLRLNKVDAALKTFQGALSKFPAGPMAEDCEFGIAKCHEAKQQYEPAVTIYAKLAAKTDSERAPEAQLNLGNRLYDLDRFDQAAAAFEKLEKTYPDSPLIPVARLNHGFSLFEVSRYEQAAEQFSIAEKDVKQAVDAGYWRGRCLLELGKFEAAADLLKGLYEANRDHRLAENLLFYRADAEHQLGHLPEAQTQFQELVARFPAAERADDALHLATLCAFEAGNAADSEKLLEQFDKSYATSPLRWSQWLLSGRLQLMKSQPAAAIPIFQQILKEEASPTTKNWARYYIGFAFLELGQPADALLATAPLAEFVMNDPQATALAGVYLLRGAGQLALGNKEPLANTQKELYAAAIDSASQFIVRAPLAKEIDQALAVRALAAAHSGLKDRAKGDVETLQSKYPQSAELEKTLYEVAEVAYSNEDWNWSEQLFGALASRGKSSKLYVQGLSGQAWSLYQRKEYEPAGKLFAQIATEFPEYKDAPEAAFMHGKCWQNHGQPTAAVPIFDETLQKYPMSRFAYLGGLEAARIRRDAMQFAEADQAYAAVLEKFPKPEHLDKVLNEWALANYEGKNYARSDEIFARLVKDVPASDLADNARLSLAESELVGGNLDSARQKFQALEQDPKSDEGVQQTSLYQLIVIGVEKKDWADIRARCEALETRFPKSKYHWFTVLQWGQAELNLMAAPKAIERLKLVVAQKDDPTVANEPWFAQAWALLAEAQYREKLYENVARTAQDCRAWKPDLPLLYIVDEVAGRALKAEQKFAEALDVFYGIVEDPHGRRTETAAKAQFMIAEIYAQQKDYQKAEAEFLKVEILYKFPDWQAPALFQAAGCQEELKHWKDAARSYQALIKDYPQSEDAKLAVDRLAKVKMKVK